MLPSEPPCLVFFAHERGDARVRKRIGALGDRGWKVLGFTFHRQRDKADGPPEWENVHLGETYNRRYLQRLWAFVKSVGVLWLHRDRMAKGVVIYAVNTDNALLALLGRFLSGKNVPLVVEIADIQPAMTGRGIVSMGLRAIERFVLGKTAMLVTTSPGFVREYFRPLQGYDGEVFLLENKVYPGAGLSADVGNAESAMGGKPWVIGCFGAFRCRRSLEVMKHLAGRLPGKVRFVLRGYPAGTIGHGFHDLLGNLPNLAFGGPYVYPDELAAIYGGIDINWVFDESDPSGNSAWLLPNRIYEGGCFGVPAIAGENTETGRWIEANGLGWTFAEPLEDSLAAFFESLEVSEWAAVKRRSLAHPREDFVGDADYTRLSETLKSIGVC